MVFTSPFLTLHKTEHKLNLKQKVVKLFLTTSLLGTLCSLCGLHPGFMHANICKKNFSSKTSQSNAKVAPIFSTAANVAQSQQQLKLKHKKQEK